MANVPVLLRLDGLFLAAFPPLGEDFFPQVDAGQMRLHVRAPPGNADRGDAEGFRPGRSRDPCRSSARDQIDVILDNIGLPYSGINIALSDSATVGPMDGEILISLNEGAHADCRAYRRTAPRIAQALCRN